MSDCLRFLCHNHGSYGSKGKCVFEFNTFVVGQCKHRPIPSTQTDAPIERDPIDVIKQIAATTCPCQAVPCAHTIALDFLASLN